MAGIDPWRAGEHPFLSIPPLVISEWEERISGPFSLGPETPNGPDLHRPALQRV